MWKGIEPRNDSCRVRDLPERDQVLDTEKLIWSWMGRKRLLNAWERCQKSKWAVRYHVGRLVSDHELTKNGRRKRWVVNWCPNSNEFIFIYVKYFIFLILLYILYWFIIPINSREFMILCKQSISVDFFGISNSNVLARWVPLQLAEKVEWNC